MYQYSNSLIRQFPSLVTGNAAVGVQATVYVGETNTLASLFEVNGSPKLNPVTTDGKGFYSFSLADGDYRIVFSSSQFATLRISVLDGSQIREEFDDLVASNLAFRNQQQAAYDSFVLSQGWDQVGTFAAGFTYTSPNQVGQDSSGNWWRWNGTFPKVVTAGTLPSSDANYKLVGDGVLRNDLAATDSTVQVGGVEAGLTARFVNGLKGLSAKANRPQTINSIYVNGLYGGGTINYDPSANKADHGKIKGDTLYIAPEAISAWSGTSGDIDTLWGWTGAGSGCYTMQRNMFHALVFGADPTGVSENYKHFGWCAKAFDGNGGYGTINILPGFYRISNTIQNLTNKIGINGGGSSNTFLQCYNTGTTPVIVSSAAAAGTNALTAYRGFSLVNQVANGYGLNIQDSAYMLFEDVYTENFAGHWLLDSVLTSTFNKCTSRFGPTGCFGLWAKNTGTSNPNALTFVGSTFSSLDGIGLRFDNPSRISYLGGSIEACGSGSGGGVVINDAGGQGAAAFTFETYFEGNGGIADVWINMSAASDPFTGVFRNSAFNRIDDKFATNNIRLTQAAGSKLAVIKVGDGCAFQKFGTYTPNSGRKYVLIDSASDNYRYVDDGSNLFSSNMEIPEILPAPLTFGASVAVDYSKYSANDLIPLTIVSGVNFQIENPTNAKQGDNFRFFIRNNFGAAGALTFGSFYKLASAITAPTINQGLIIEFKFVAGGIFVETNRVTGIQLV